MKEEIVFTVKATKATDGTTQAAKAFEKEVKATLKAVAIDGVKLVVR